MPHAVAQRYHALRVVAGIIRGLTYFLAVLSILQVLLVLVFTSEPSLLLIGSLVIGLLFTGLLCLFFIAAAETIHLFIDIEHNTRVAVAPLKGTGRPKRPKGRKRPRKPKAVEAVIEPVDEEGEEYEGDDWEEED
ncbi:MAG: hypothetical protein ACYTHM_20570 [Planctomycetota bacterium]|jgi:hypothetical protein